jgi:O-antigen/teichoic acid export membrane protein
VAKLLDGLSRLAGAESGFRRYLVNTSWLMTGRGAQILLGLVVGAWLSRYLGPDRYGVYAFALSFATLFAPLANLGLGQIIVREIVKDPLQRDKVLGTAMGIRLMGTGVAYSLIALGLLFFLPDPATRLAVVLASSAIVLRSMQMLIYYFQAVVQSRQSSIPHLVSLLVSNGLKVWFILLGLDVVAFLWLVVVDAAVYSALLVLAYNRQGLRFASWRFDRDLAGTLLKKSWPLMFTLILFTIYMQIDQVMLKFLGENKEVGWYNAAVRLSTATYAIPFVLTNSLFPAILSAAKNNKELFRKRMARLYHLLIYIAVVLILLTWAFSDSIIQIIFGTAYAPAAPVLTIHVAAALFVFMGHAAEKWLIAEDKQYYFMLAVLLGAALNVVLNLWMIPRFGITGAAWATLCAQVLSYHIAPFFFPQSRKVFYIQNLALLQVLSGWALWHSFTNRKRSGS